MYLIFPFYNLNGMHLDLNFPGCNSFFFLNRSIVDLQCCVKFQVYRRVIQLCVYVCIHTHITHIYIYFKILYFSRSLLDIYFCIIV